MSTAIHEVARRVEKVVQPGEEEECGEGEEEKGGAAAHTQNFIK